MGSTPETQSAPAFIPSEQRVRLTQKQREIDDGVHLDVI
jgi:hypothetical protein